MDENPDIDVISQLKELKHLTLNLYDSCRLDLVTPLLDFSGRSLSKLDLHFGDDWFFVAPVHNLIAQFCPNLVSLTMQGDYKVIISRLLFLTFLIMIFTNLSLFLIILSIYIYKTECVCVCSTLQNLFFYYFQNFYVML